MTKAAVRSPWWSREFVAVAIHVMVRGERCRQRAVRAGADACRTGR